MTAKEVLVALLVLGVASAGDINRQSIIFYPETPDLFYCPQEKPISLGGMLVKARPLKKLCEFEGRPLPQDYQSDCWNDVDESEFACSEKSRILLQLKPPGSENAVIDNYVPIFKPGQYKIRHLDDKGRFIDEIVDAAAADDDKKRKPKNQDF